jgi:hypothetical protein
VPLDHEFDREDVFPSWFPNRLQDFLSAARTDLRLSLKSSTVVQIIPDEALGIAAVAIDGRWRFITKTIERVHPGGAKGTYVIWAIATDNDVDNTPDPFTDHTDYAFQLRITSGAKPTGEGVEVVEKIGEIDWSGTEIEALRQTHSAVTGPMLADGALSSEAPSDITWTRAANGGLIAGFKANSVGATELADEAVDTNALIALAVTTAKIAAEAITEAKLATGSVVAAKIAALAVETAKIAAKAVTEGKLGDEAVNTGQIKALAVTSAKLAAEAVTGEKVGALAITEAKLAAEAVSTAKIANLAVTEAKLANEGVATGKIKNLAVTAAKLAEAAVEEAKIADGAVTSRKAKLTSGLAKMTADKKPGEAYEDVEGASATFTLAVKSFVIVEAVWDMEATPTGEMIGTMRFDAADNAATALLKCKGEAAVDGERATVPQVYREELAAGEHTIKMRVKKVGISGVSLYAAGTRFTYFVHAA